MSFSYREHHGLEHLTGPPSTSAHGAGSNSLLRGLSFDDGVSALEPEHTLGRGFHQVSPGDTFWKIAQETLGDGRKWRTIHDLNRDQVPDPNVLPIGVILKLPGTVPTTYRADDNSTNGASTNVAPRNYTVQRGETLSSIAAKVLGDAGSWQSIWNLNRDVIPNPSLIQVGMMLSLPGGAVHSADPEPEVEEIAEEISAPVSNTPCVVVQPMDSLWALAQRHLGDGNRWRDIFDLNRDVLSNPDRLKVGTSLRLPEGNCNKPPAPTTTGPLAPGEMPANLTGAQRIAWNWHQKHGALIKSGADDLGIEEAVAGGILIAESTDSGFKDGRLKIRFEPQVFAWYDSGPTVWVEEDTQSGHYDAFERAKARNEDGAYKAISMGASQVMGFNAEMIGYQNAQQMFQAFQQGEGVHLRGMFSYFKNVPGLVPAAKNHDWRKVAYLYNGEGYESNAYHVKIESYFNAYEHVLSVTNNTP